MTKVAVLALATAALAVALLAPAPAGAAIKVHKRHVSSQYGGYQTFVGTQAGKTVLGVGFLQRKGRYRLCIKDPAPSTSCHNFRLKFSRQSGAYISFIYLSKRFPHSLKGRYVATWFKAGHRLGPPLGFAGP